MKSTAARRRMRAIVTAKAAARRAASRMRAKREVNPRRRRKKTTGKERLAKLARVLSAVAASPGCGAAIVRGGRPTTCVTINCAEHIRSTGVVT